MVPVGTLVEGHVISAHRSGRLHLSGRLELTLDNDREPAQHSLATSEVAARGKSHKKRNWGWIGGGTEEER